MKPPKTLEWLYDNIEHIYNVVEGSGKGRLGINYTHDNQMLFETIDVRTFKDRLLNLPYLSFEELEAKCFEIVNELIKDNEYYKEFKKLK